MDEFSTDKLSEQSVEERLALFLRLYNANFRRMYIYAKMLLPDEEHVEDVLQEVSLSLWKKFSEFRSESNFAHWASGMIRVEILRWRSRQSREFLHWNEDYFVALAERSAQRDDAEVKERYEALIRCTDKLPAKMRNLIVQRYFHKKSIAQIAEQTRKSADAIYQQLSRARGLLKKCVEKSMES